MYNSWEISKIAAVKDLQIKKLYYSISEVGKLIDEEHYVLRYWETEFEQLRPQKNRAGNRIYTQKDISVIKMIKLLLREKRYTIDGAKSIMKEFNPDTGEIPGLHNEADEQPAGTEQALPQEQSSDSSPTLTRDDLVHLRDTLRKVLQLLGAKQ